MTLENIRAIETASFEIALGTTTVLVGTNNAGKSSILEALASAFWSLPSTGPSPPSADRSFNRSVYRRVGATTARPRAVIEFSVEEVLGSTAVAGLTDLTLRATLDAAIAPGAVTHTESSGWATTRLVLEGPGGADSLVTPISETVGPHDNIDTVFVSTHLIEGGEWRPFTPNRPTGRVSRDNLFTLASTSLTSELRRLVHSTIYLSAGRSAAYGTGGETRLYQGTISQTTQLLKGIHLSAARWPQLVAAFTSLFEDVETLKFDFEQQEQTEPYVVFKRGDARPAGRTGFGMRQSLGLLAVLFSAPPGAIIFADEPEQGLNSSRQRDLARILELARADVSVVLATQAEGLCKGLSAANVYLVEPEGSHSTVVQLELAQSVHRRKLAKAMGSDPLFLSDNGKIVFVEGRSDRRIIEDWMRLNGLLSDAVEVQELEGGDKIGEEFAKPLFRNFASWIFVILDSDCDNSGTPSATTKRRITWLQQAAVGHYVLKRHEIENYLGSTALSRAVNVSEGRIAPPGGSSEQIWDYKTAIIKERGAYSADWPVAAYKTLAQQRQRQLFGDENAALLEALRQFAREQG